MTYDESVENFIESGKENRFKSGEQRAKECGSVGGINSGKTRRRKRTLKQAAELVMSLPVTNKKTLNKLKRMGIDPEDADNQTAVIVGLLGRAVTGDPKASALLFELLDDTGAGTNEQTEAHNALIEAIRGRNNAD